MGAPVSSSDDSAAASLVDRSMAVAETLLYAAVAILLVVSAVAAVGTIGYHLVSDLDDGALAAVEASLDGLLLVFILIELLGAVRATVSERQLLAEPFLIVGMIAAIKEMVVASLKAGDLEGDALVDAMVEIGVLGGVVLLLAIASFLVRRKEREPSEEDG
jgi:uncharacterized membrane protein (DUF373 family)